jgi:Pvc16 N-terminal domain
MIGTTLEFLQKRLDEALRVQLEGSLDLGTADKVVLPVLNANAAESTSFTNGAVTMVLINLEEERLCREADPWRGGGALAGSRLHQPDLRLNLHLLFVARFSSSVVAWNHLTAILNHFQFTPVLDAQTAPQLPDGVDRLVFELLSQSFTELNDVWNALRSPYHPSLLYRARLLVLRDPSFRVPIPVAAGEARLSGGLVP